MSTFAYGRLVRRQKETVRAAGTDEGMKAAAAEKAEENKLVTAVAALIPTEIVALHTLVLTKTTTTDANGATTITNLEPLRWSLIALLIAAVVVYLIGRGFKRWRGNDFWRLLLAPLAVLVWTGIVGTSALTPWVASLNQTYVVLVAGFLGIVLVAVSARINPPKPQ